MKNESGLTPIGYRVLIKLDPIKETTAGGIVLPDQIKQQEDLATTEGTIAAVGEKAFENFKLKPQPGDRVVFSKYAGIILHGNDGERYRVIDDENDIAAIKEIKEKDDE